MLPGELVVTLSMVTVLLAALETMMAMWAVVGATPFDQFAGTSHLPLAELIQLLAPEMMFDTIPTAVAMTIPYPESRSTPLVMISSAELSSAIRTSRGVCARFLESTSAAIPAACGAAADVPENGLKFGTADP